MKGTKRGCELGGSTYRSMEVPGYALAVSDPVSTLESMIADLGEEQFALTEASYITVRLMQEFDRIESRDAEPWREKLTLTCTGFNGCKVSLTTRE